MIVVFGSFWYWMELVLRRKLKLFRMSFFFLICFIGLCICFGSVLISKSWRLWEVIIVFIIILFMGNLVIGILVGCVLCYSLGRLEGIVFCICMNYIGCLCGRIWLWLVFVMLVLVKFGVGRVCLVWLGVFFMEVFGVWLLCFGRYWVGIWCRLCKVFIVIFVMVCLSILCWFLLSVIMCVG